MRDWLGLHRKEEKKKDEKRNKGGKPFYGEVCSIYRKDIGIKVFEARERSKKPLLFMEKAIGEIKQLLNKSLFFVRE